jgi:hypothetical protein
MRVSAVTIAMFAGAIAVGVLAFGFLRSDSPGGEAAAVVSASGPDKRPMATLQGGAGDTEASPPKAAPSRSVPSSPLPHPRSTDPMTQAPGGATPAPPTTEPADAEKVFVAEAVDPAWAAGMEATLYEQIGEIAGKDLVTVNTECRTTLCRLQVTQRVPMQAGRSADESPAMYDMYEKLFARLGFESRSITSTSDGNGLVSSVVYLPRGDLDSPAAN